MRLPQPLIESKFFQFERLADLERAIGEHGSALELAEIRRLTNLGLPPIASSSTLATMLGVNRGLIWSLVNRPRRYYRRFSIPKGKEERIIHAPRVALKIPQKWIGVQLSNYFRAPAHVFGFVPHRSHVDAARVHLGAKWVLSLDIENFFPSTPQELVEQALVNIGFGEAGANLIASLACFNGFLAQGSPCSPTLSNYCFSPWDESLALLAAREGVRISRYADDIVLSGHGTPLDGLQEQIAATLANSPWRLSQRKISLSVAPARLKVHGLLVSGDRVRLTKGYRNKLRTFEHILQTRENLDAKFERKVRGHLAYGKFVEA
ncbi:MAG: RNA-directed DNA polymerase [Desulfurellales bacterium]|nr:MAG: RNA-directed DNA polymerase [Desulfurellales bacterium]